MGSVLRVVSLLWTLVPLGAMLAAVFLLLSSRFATDLRQSFRGKGGAGVGWTLLVVVVLGHVGSGALERRDTGASPFTAIPWIGGLISRMGTNGHVDQAMIAVALVAIARAFVDRSQGRGNPLGRATGLLVVWVLLIAGVTALHLDGSPSGALTPLIAVLLSAVAVLLLANELPPALLDRAMLAITASVLLVNVWGLIAGTGWSYTTDWPGGFVSGARFQGSFPQPNVSGMTFACFAVYAACARTWSWPTRIVIGSVGFYLVILTGSRGALGILLAGAIYAIWLKRREVLAVPAVLLLLAIAVVLPSTSAPGSAVINGREVTWAIAERVISLNPLFGQGVFALTTASGDRSATYAHNQFLQTMLETGLIGALLMFVIILRLVRRLAHPGAVLPFGAILVGQVSTFSFENPLRTYELPFAFLLSLFLMSVSALERRDLVDPSVDATSSEFVDVRGGAR